MSTSTLEAFASRNPLPRYQVASEERVEGVIVSYNSHQRFQEAVREAKEQTFKSNEAHQIWVGFVYDQHGQIIYSAE